MSPTKRQGHEERRPGSREKVARGEVGDVASLRDEKAVDCVQGCCRHPAPSSVRFESDNGEKERPERRNDEEEFVEGRRGLLERERDVVGEWSGRNGRLNVFVTAQLR
jgi:hypothetical protein